MFHCSILSISRCWGYMHFLAITLFSRHYLPSPHISSWTLNDFSSRKIFNSLPFSHRTVQDIVLIKNNLGEERPYFILQLTILHLGQTKVGFWGRNLEAGTRAETTEEHCLQEGSPFMQRVALPAEGWPSNTNYLSRKSSVEVSLPGWC